MWAEVYSLLPPQSSSLDAILRATTIWAFLQCRGSSKQKIGMTVILKKAKWMKL